MLDTRKHRSDETADPEERTILGDAQLAALHNWLARVNGTAVWKFVVSSVPLSTLWAYDAKEDSWAAFDKERQSVLSALTTVDNVVVLTGDRHQYAVIDFFGGRLLEISTSPLSQFDLAIKGIPALGRWASAETFNRTVVALNATDGTEYQATVQTPVERVLEYIPKVGDYIVPFGHFRTLTDMTSHDPVGQLQGLFHRGGHDRPRCAEACGRADRQRQECLADCGGRKASSVVGDASTRSPADSKLQGHPRVGPLESR